MKTHRGFTLIELIVVIVILGILAATALPKFVDLNRDAKIAVVKNLEGTMRATNALIYAKAATAGVLSAGPNNITINGVSVQTTYGYAANLGNLILVMDIDTSGSGDFATSGQQLQHRKASTPSTCGVTLGFTATTPPTPTYTTVTSGC